MTALLETLQQLATWPATVALTVATAFLLLSWDWRVSITALIVQYTMIGAFLFTLVPAPIAVIKLLVGLLCAMMIYWSARQAHTTAHNLAQEPLPRAWPTPLMPIAYRVTTLLLVGLITFGLTPALQIDYLPPHINLTVLWLISAGLSLLFLGSHPFYTSTGILTLLSAFDLIYTPIEPSLVIIGFFSTAQLMTSLALAYLITIPVQEAQR